MTLTKLLHLNGLRHYWNLYLINHVYAGTKTRYFERKRKLLNSIGHQIGEGTKVVGPVYCTGKLITGNDCWIGADFTIRGNGTVTIGNNCDIGPDVSFQTGGHTIGTAERRAGDGVTHNIMVGNGTWIGARSTFVNSISVGNACVIAACACVTKNVGDNTLVGGVPAKEIRELE